MAKNPKSETPTAEATTSEITAAATATATTATKKAKPVKTAATMASTYIAKNPKLKPQLKALKAFKAPIEGLEKEADANGNVRIGILSGEVVEGKGAVLLVRCADTGFVYRLAPGDVHHPKDSNGEPLSHLSGPATPFNPGSPNARKAYVTRKGRASKEAFEGGEIPLDFA